MTIGDSTDPASNPVFGSAPNLADWFKEIDDLIKANTDALPIGTTMRI